MTIPFFATSAVHYWARDIPVFPVKSRQKEPLITGWQTAASTDRDVLDNWARLYPNANVGIPTGPPSGLMVVDVDPRHDGDDSLFELEKRIGVLPRTLTVITGTGGTHIYMTFVPGLRNSAGKLGPGLDIRAEGGYVVGAGSIHPNGRRYEFEV